MPRQTSKLLAYSSNLASSDFGLFPKVKMAMKEARFKDIVETQRNMIVALKAIINSGQVNIPNFLYAAIDWRKKKKSEKIYNLYL